MTDDDCLPEPGWAGAIATALDAGVGVVQGMTLPAEGGPSGSWDRTIAVRQPSGLYETCNLGFTREAFLAADGFQLLSALGRAPRGFGEDVLLGVAVARASSFAWTPSAVVRHRWLPGTFRDHLAGRRRLSGFPLLVREVPALRSQLWGRWFLTRRTASFDAAVLGVVLIAATRRRRALLALTPWLAIVVPEARRSGRRLAARRLAQAGVADATAAASLVAGSIRHRSIVL